MTLTSLLERVESARGPDRELDGWIEHDGGPCPVAPMTVVQAKFRDGYIDPPHMAGIYDGSGGQPDWWSHKESDGLDIVAYRIVEEA